MNQDTTFRLRGLQPAQSFTLQEIHVHLKESGAAACLPGGSDLRSALEKRTETQTGRLALTCKLEQDTRHWEMHPAGDELLVALSGAFEVVLQEVGLADRIVELATGRSLLVPFGSWHRIRVKTPGEILSVTPGKGTQYRQA